LNRRPTRIPTFRRTALAMLAVVAVALGAIVPWLILTGQAGAAELDPFATCAEVRQWEAAQAGQPVEAPRPMFECSDCVVTTFAAVPPPVAALAPAAFARRAASAVATAAAPPPPARAPPRPPSTAPPHLHD